MIAFPDKSICAEPVFEKRIYPVFEEIGGRLVSRIPVPDIRNRPSNRIPEDPLVVTLPEPTSKPAVEGISSSPEEVSSTFTLG